MSKKNLKNRKGFTIVELLVAIGLFGVIISIAIGGFVRALHTQKQIVALISANSNVSLVIEQMSREIRTGSGFCALTPCAPNSLNFTNARGENITYFFESQASGNGIINRQVNSGTPAQITADNVNIRYLNFLLLNDASFPARITILVGVSPAKNQASAVSENITNIESTVSARTL